MDEHERMNEKRHEEVLQKISQMQASLDLVLQQFDVLGEEFENLGERFERVTESIDDNQRNSSWGFMHLFHRLGLKRPTTVDSASDNDELYEKARTYVMEAGKASTSYLQRRLGIGYARAARLIDMLEERGIIGLSGGARPREVIEKGSN